MRQINKETCKLYVQEQKEELKKIVKANELEIYTVFIIQVGDEPASNSYIKGKIKDCSEIGLRYTLIKVDTKITTIEITKLIHLIKERKNVNHCAGIFVQLPLPEHIDVKEIIKAIPDEFDVDGFKKTSKFKPCTPKGVINYLEYVNFDFKGKIAVVLGRSEIVGKPIVDLLRNKDCTIIQCHSKTREEDMIDLCRKADLIVSAVGQQNFIRKEFINENKHQILIDVGINRNDEGKLCGDADPEIYECENLEYTPVPGGVGLFTRLALIENLVNSALMQKISRKKEEEWML